MSRWRIVLFSFLICLPAVVAAVIGTVYAVGEISSWSLRERVRVTSTYRAAATDLKDAVRTNRLAGTAFPLPERRKGWRAVGKIDGRSWGLGRTNGMEVVWVTTRRKDAVFAPVPPVRPVDRTRTTLLAAGCLFIDLVLIGLAALAVWWFVRFMREREDFLAATAHDLTTPLVGLRLTIGRNANEARVLNERMIRLVDNLKDFLRLGGRRPATKREVFDVVAAYREAYALFAADYRDLWDGADVAVEGVADGETFPVLADETRTVQVLWNLLGNDLKYAAPYGRVAVRFSQADGFVRIAFVDEGQGMTPRQMRKAFDRYYRAKTALVSGKGGFGIGLCTAREFARAMGGDLTVRANAPTGCVFTLSLPAARNF